MAGIVQHRQCFLQSSTVLYELSFNSSVLIQLYLKNKSHILFTLVPFPEAWAFMDKSFEENFKIAYFLFKNTYFLPLASSSSQFPRTLPPK